MNISMFTAYGIEQALNGSFKTPQEAFRHMFDLGINYGDIADIELACYPLHLYCDILKDSGITPNCLIATADTMGSLRKPHKNLLSKFRKKDKKLLRNVKEYGII